MGWDVLTFDNWLSLCVLPTVSLRFGITSFPLSWELEKSIKTELIGRPASIDEQLILFQIIYMALSHSSYTISRVLVRN